MIADTMNVITKTIDFFREVKVELTKVVWPSRTQTIQLTVLVIMLTLIVGFFIGAIDYGLTMLTQYLLIR
jgi:preprotein translocase subunit SecE